VELDGARILSLSPDGRSLAVNKQGTLCVVDAASLRERSCARLRTGKFDRRGIAWSPDGRRIAFTEDLLEYFQESDLWVMDVDTGRLRNLTDDGLSGSFLELERKKDKIKKDKLLVDTIPAWAPDGETLLFFRSPGTSTETALYTVPAQGGAATKLATVTSAQAFAAFYGLRWAPDGRRIYYTLVFSEPGYPANGIWTVARDGRNRRHLLGWNGDRGYPLLLELSASGRRALVYYPLIAYQHSSLWHDAFSLLDLSTGEETPVLEAPTRAGKRSGPFNATLSPEGSSLLYVYQEGGERRLAVRDLDSGEERVLVRRKGAGAYGNAPDLGAGLDWARDGTIFVADGPTAGYLISLESK
jgi:Tol biopolymer transport system component